MGSPKKKADAGFEKSLERLEEISDILRNNSASLQESVELFEEGAALYERCTDLLENARSKIEIFVRETGKMEDFNE